MRNTHPWALARQRREIARLEAENEKLREKNDILREAIEAWNTTPKGKNNFDK